MKKLIRLTHSCIFCNKSFTSFSYAFWHINNSHASRVRIERMNHPVLESDIKRVLVYNSPQKKGIDVTHLVKIDNSDYYILKEDIKLWNTFLSHI